MGAEFDHDGFDDDVDVDSDEPTHEVAPATSGAAASGLKEMARFVPGIQPVREALRAKTRIERILFAIPLSAEMEALERFAVAQGATVERVGRDRLDRLTRGGRHQGVLALARPFELVAPKNLELDNTTLGMALDELEDPQNFGAIVRSVVSLGGSFILWPEHHSAPLSMATVRASAGAVEHATLCRVPNLPQALLGLREQGVKIIGLDMSGQQELSECDLTGPVVLVIGAEGKGLRKPVKQACTSVVKLPMSGPVSSLNASVAAGIALYEVNRNRARAALAK